MTKVISTIATALVVLIALQHLAFLVVQIFLWEHEIGIGMFGTTPDTAAISATLAKQQGLYNGFLAAGLLWGLFTKSHSFILFFLFCVIAAGVFGALTASTSILFIQGLPAILALIMTLLSSRAAQE